MGRPTGAKAYVTKTFESELESDYETDGHKYKRNSDPMAGGAVPSHAATAFRAGKPSFYSDPVRLGLYSAGLILLICAEAAALFSFIADFVSLRISFYSRPQSIRRNRQFPTADISSDNSSVGEHI